jgi:hypothetical protein
MLHLGITAGLATIGWIHVSPALEAAFAPVRYHQPNPALVIAFVAVIRSGAE